MINKYSVVIILFIFFRSTNLNAQTQAERIDDAYKVLHKTEMNLDQIYKNVIKNLTGKKKEHIIKSQKDWLKYKNSHCRFETELFDGGSIQPLIYANCLSQKTQERADELEAAMIETGRYYK